MTYTSVLLQSTFAATFIPFTYVNLFTLRRLGSISGEKLALNAACTLGAALLGLLVWTATPGQAYTVLFAVFQVAALALFVFSLRAHRRAPAHAFTNERPDDLTRKGPYRIIRHPIYAAYMLFWLSGVFLHWAFLFCVLILFVAYWRAAVREERAFLSDVRYASRYADYRRVTGAFVPQWWVGAAAGNGAGLLLRARVAGRRLRRLPKSHA